MDQLPAKPSTRQRRTFTREFKAMVVNLSNEPDQSVASVALRFELNANVLHKWRREHAGKQPAEFIRLPVPAQPVLTGKLLKPATVQIELRGGITVHWPIDQIDRSVPWLQAMIP